MKLLIRDKMKPNLQHIYTSEAPKPIGAYCQAIQWKDLIFCAGQIAIDPSTGQVISGGIGAETQQVLNNIKQVLKAADSDFNHILKTTIYLSRLDDAPIVNDIYEKQFNNPLPARSTVEVSRLPKNAAIEIEVIAFRGSVTNQCTSRSE